MIDVQDNGYARKTFSIEVEQAMRTKDFEAEADFCRLVREWYDAEDNPGISAENRAKAKLRFRDFLLEESHLDRFPPPYGGAVHGLPPVLFEGLVSSIDTSIQLYAICREGTYNQRAAQSLVNETFNGYLSELEPTKLGCPKATGIPRLMSTVTEILHYRHNPKNRLVHIFLSMPIPNG